MKKQQIYIRAENEEEKKLFIEIKQKAVSLGISIKQYILNFVTENKKQNDN